MNRRNPRRRGELAGNRRETAGAGSQLPGEAENRAAPAADHGIEEPVAPAPRLRSTEELLRLLVENVTDYAIIVLDPEGRVATWNRGAERLKGYRADEIIGRHFSQFYPPEAIDRRWPEHELEIARATGRFEDEGWRVRRDGTHFWANVVISAVRDADGVLQGFAKVTRDLTERKRAEEAMQQAQADLEWRVEERTAELADVNVALREEIAERRRLEDELRRLVSTLEESDRNKNIFLATLAHELRNPLAPVRTAAELLRLKLRDDPSITRSLDIIERQVRQMVRLIDDLLDLSRITRNTLMLRKEPVDLKEVVQHAVETSRPFIEAHGQELTVAVPDEPVVMSVDAARLAQVLSNLMNNASKFTPAGGHIALDLRREGPDVAISVRDDGIGIRQDQLGRIFDMFAQLDQAPPGHTNGGLGIGLTLSRRLIEMHGGTIEPESEGPGKGARFTLRLPSTDADGRGNSAKAADPRKDAPIAAVRRRILIADDNHDAVESLLMVLNLFGAEVRTAYDGLAAVEMAREFRPDVVLLDIGMPRLDGVEAGRQIRQQPWGSEMLLIAMTGWGQDEHRRRTRDAGFDHHLIKPVDPRALRKLLMAERPG